MASSRPSHERRRLLDDPLVIRALAHPRRLDLLSIVGLAGTLTTAGAARQLGISHGLASHHLRQLRKYGFVEHVEGKDNRERPWRLVATSQSWGDADATPEGAAAVAVLERIQAEQALSHLIDWLQRRKGWPGAWRKCTGVDRSKVYLTVAELGALVDAMNGLIADYIEKRPIDDLSSRPAGSVPIEFTVFVVPLSEPTEKG